jgi:RHS repeat-associated protein
LSASEPERKALDKAVLHAGTPAKTYFDALRRPFSVVLHNMEGTPTPSPAYHETKVVLDALGAPTATKDALSRDCMTYSRSMLGAVLAQTSIDAGTRRAFTTAKGEHVKSWGERSFTMRSEYDTLRRPLRRYMHDGSTEKLVERLVWGEAHASVSANNLKAKLIQHYDQSGVMRCESYDFKGNPLEHKRRLATNYTTTVDWSAIATMTDPASILSTAGSLLHSEEFTHTAQYDALNRPTSLTTPDSTETKPTYNLAGLLDKVEARVRGAGTWTTFVSNIDYDEKARRTKITYSNDTETTYSYDKLTFRLSSFETKRATGNKTLQKLTYTYDPVGNIVIVKDESDQTLLFSAATIPSNDAEYTYDAVYRLVVALGREHEAGTTTQYDDTDVTDGHTIAHPNDPSGLRRYGQYFAYDAVGNITSMQHDLDAGQTGEWTRTYTYVSGKNRLSQTTQGGGNRNYSHDAHGNMTAMPHLNTIDWDYADQMRHVQVDAGGGQHVYFRYDAGGTRIRKVYEHDGLREERIYLGGYELYRKTIISTSVLDFERETMHFADDARRVCMVETKTRESGSAIGSPTPRYRFQLDNHLGTSCMECDSSGAIITYEDYHPYGTSAYRAWKTGTEVSAKRYRYTGKERDDETSLYYHGARYYAPWLGRWTAADPMGTVDGTNLYAYVRGSPVNLMDPNGLWPWDSDPVKEANPMALFQAQAALLNANLKLVGETAFPSELPKIVQETRKIAQSVGVKTGALEKLETKLGSPSETSRVDLAIAAPDKSYEGRTTHPTEENPTSQVSILQGDWNRLKQLTRSGTATTLGGLAKQAQALGKLVHEAAHEEVLANKALGADVRSLAKEYARAGVHLADPKTGKEVASFQLEEGPKGEVVPTLSGIDLPSPEVLEAKRDYFGEEVIAEGSEHIAAYQFFVGVATRVGVPDAAQKFATLVPKTSFGYIGTESLSVQGYDPKSQPETLHGVGTKITPHAMNIIREIQK